MSHPPTQRVVDTTKWSNINGQSESISECVNYLSPAYAGEDIKAESVIDGSDYKEVDPRLSFNRCEDMEEQKTTGYFMRREQEGIQTNVKEEEDDWGWQSVKLEREDGVRDDEGLWNEEEKEWEEQKGGCVTDQFAQTDKLVKNVEKSEHGQPEGEELSTVVTSCLLKQPRVLIRRLEIANSSVAVSSPPCSAACNSDQGVRSPWRQHELSPLRGSQSQRQKALVVTQKTDQLERPHG